MYQQDIFQKKLLFFWSCVNVYLTYGLAQEKLNLFSSVQVSCASLPAHLLVS